MIPFKCEGCEPDVLVFFFSSRRRHTRLQGDWSSDVCSSDLAETDRSRAEANIASEHEAQVLRDSLAAARSALQQARGAWLAWQASQEAATLDRKSVV